MGYDDNTPLTGVTGGGLPAEIWHEVMVRVHEGTAARPLPMLRPDQLPPRDPSAFPAPYATGTGLRPQPAPNSLDQAINGILGAIFGTGN